MDYKTITDTIDTAAANYAAVVTKTEKKLLEKALTEAKALETDSAGKLKFSLANLRRLGAIKAALAKAAANKAYLKGVSDLASAIGQIEAEQIKYYSTAFGAKSISDGFKDKCDYVKKLAVKNTIDRLTGAGLDAGVLNGINALLMKAVTTSSSYKDLTDQLYKTLSSGDGQTSTFARYANTYATTAMTQYAGQNNKMFTDDLDIRWFRYVGSNIETTRPFCEALTAKEWIYITEIPDILAGKIDLNGTIKTLPLNPKTNLPYGLIDGTTPDNFMVNVGGWNCRHQLVPVSAAAVPQNIRDKYDEEAKKKAEEKAKIAAFKKWVEDHKDFVEFDMAAAQKAIADKDFAAMAKMQADMADYKNRLHALDQLEKPEEAAKKFTLSELEKVNMAIKDTLDKWVKKHGYSSLEENLDHAANKLQFEIDQVNKSKKYSTWNIAVNAYKKKLDAINALKAAKQMAGVVAKYKSFATKSKIYANLLNQLDAAVAAGDNASIKILCGKLDSQQKKLAKGKNPTNKLIDKAAKHDPKSTNNTAQLDHLSEANMSMVDALKYIEKLTGITDKVILERLYDAVYGFSYKWDFEIRAVQCGSDVKSIYGHSLDDIVKRAMDLEDFIAASPKWKGSTTYRGMSLSPMEYDDLKKQLIKGEGNMKGSASWSTSQHTAERFACSHLGENSPTFGDRKSMEVVLITKGHETATSIRYLSRYAGENEVLASKKCRYRYIRDYTVGNTTYVEVEPNI